MSFFDSIGSSLGGFFGQQDDELKKALAQTANLKNTQAILTQGADASAQMPGSMADTLARQNAEMGLTPEESQQQIASSINTPSVENVDLGGGDGWDLKGMSEAFLKSQEGKPKEKLVTSGKLMRGAGGAAPDYQIQGVQPMQQDSRAANAIMMAAQQIGGQPQQQLQQKKTMFQQMMGFA